jgi:hypothetical protein
MATLAAEAVSVRSGSGGDEKFFLVSAILMASVLVAGFAMNAALGRSTFASPPRVHAHAFVFFGWTVLYVTQNALAARGSLQWHRQLGWAATAWIPLMAVSGMWMTIAGVRAGRTPPFFEPAGFLTMNTVHMLAFVCIAAAALLYRKQTQWHRRLWLCAMAMLLGPGFGRLLPMPLLIPWSSVAVVLPGLLFPLAGVVRDLRRSGSVHPAWVWGIGTMLAAVLLVELAGSRAPGLAYYEAVTQGAPAAQPPLGYPILRAQ